MARVEFDGKGVPIPSIALPPIGGDDDLPATVLTFTESTTFAVQQYRELGFTHFDVSCVGAAGGRGGDAQANLFYVIENFWRPVPQDVWNLYIEYLRLYYQFYGLAGDPAPNQEAYNPNHLMLFYDHREMLMRPSYAGFGGGGGGGGLHKVSGALAGLPDEIPITVGKAGADAADGQIRIPGAFTPIMSTPEAPPSSPIGDPKFGNGGSQQWFDMGNRDSLGFPSGRAWDIRKYLRDYTMNPAPIANSFVPPVSGQDGGASIFGDGIAQASGGRGGEAGRVYTGAPTQTGFVLKGNGGDGGVGGSSAPGGGGAGSTSHTANGADGYWHPEVGIGAGGGGGKGGWDNSSLFGSDRVNSAPLEIIPATAGGQGSYSYADASVYGTRQFRQPASFMRTDESGSKPYPFPQAYNYFLGFPGPGKTGVVVQVPVVDENNKLIPGGGGGARPDKNLKYGSRALGFSPDGVVVLRLTRIT